MFSNLLFITIHFLKKKYLHISRSRNEVMMMLRRNSNIDVNMLRRKYPDVDVDKLLRDDKTRGHFVPKVDA